MVQYASGSIKFSGLGSKDTDFQAMIDKLYSIETRQVNQLLRWKADWEKRLEAFKQIRSELMNMQSALIGLNSVDKFLVKQASSSEDKVVTAVAGASALNGTYDLDIQQLASQYSWSKNTNLYDKNDVICDDPAGGVLQYRYKGTERTLHIPTGTTVEGLKNLINNDSRNPGVKAQLIHSQDGIVFQLSSKDTGSANSLLLQKTDGMSAFGSLVLTNQQYIEQQNSIQLAAGFTSVNDPINPGPDAKTFIFTVDGNRKSISVPAGATIQDLVNEINLWGDANVKSQNGEQIASLEQGSDNLYYFKIAKRDSVYGAGTYNDDLLNVLTSSYGSGEALFTSGTVKTYSLTVIPPTGSEYTISVALNAGETLEDLRQKFADAIDASSASDKPTVSIVTDPNDSSKQKLNFGPVISQNAQSNIFKAWNDPNVDTIDTTTGPTEYKIRISNSDLGAQDSDIISLTLAQGGVYTVNDICNSINSALGSRGTAKMVQDGTQWRISIETTSATHRVTVEEGTLEALQYKLPEEASGTWLIHKGENAKLRVNGWPSEPNYLESATNNIAAGSMIDGMSLTLRSVGKAVISVANDTQKMAENVESFVQAVNNFRIILQSLTMVDNEKSQLDPDYADSQFEMQKGSVLTGNYGIQLLQSRLSSAVANSARGFSYRYLDPLTENYFGDIFSSLSQIGITTNATEGHANYGLLEINSISGLKGSKTLEEALLEDPEAVARLFSARSEGVSNNQDLFQHNSHIATIAKPGTYSVEYTVQLDGNGDPFIASAFINGKAAKIDNDNRQISLLEPNDDPARSITLDVYNMTPNVQHKGSVSIKEGKVNELLSMMDGTEGLLGTSGTLRNLEKNYQNIIDNIEKKIKQEDDRLVKWRRTMDMKFARLDAVLAKYNAMNESLQTQIAQLGQQTKKQ